MKQIFVSIAFVLVPVFLAAQQMPISENYFLDKYSLSPSYAGHSDPGNLVAGYRSDWSGIEGGPKTLRLSYSDMIMTNAAYGGKLIYDKAGIYNQLYLMGTYSYNLKVSDEHKVLLALSAGIYNNTINFTDYYNDPKYNIDPVMISDDVRSRLKFMSDFSAVYLFRDLEAGIMFANLNFGDAKYSDADVTYKPLANYQVHAAYLYRFDDRWAVNPLIYLRGGRYIRNQAGIATRVIYQNNLWAGLSFRDPSIIGFGLGGKITRGISFAYNFNMATSVELNVYNNHEVAVGINVRDLFRPKTSE